MDELKDWSTSIGRSVSVRVGEGLGEENRDPKDSTMGDEEKLMMVTFWMGYVSLRTSSVGRFSYCVHPV